jgi:hypothetical protein
MQHPGDQPWRSTLKEAICDIIKVVQGLLASGGVSEMLLDEGIGIEVEILNGAHRQVESYMDFYQARDRAIDNGWVENKTGRWLG